MSAGRRRKERAASGQRKERAMKPWIAGLLQARQRCQPAPSPGAPGPPAARVPGETGAPGFDFDTLAKDLAAGLSRREALRRLGLGLGGAVLAALGAETAFASSVVRK